MSAERTRPPIDLRASQARVKAGGIPLRAVERLADEAGPDRRLFTSDLSVGEFLLARDAGCEPISQVMGSCIYHVGQIPDYKGATGEIKVISDGHRVSRRAAIRRLYEEAQLVGADAVIGVHLRDRMITMGARGKGGDDGGEVLEFTVVGTAVRAPWISRPAGQPVITDLSGQDLWALYHDGYEPCGFLFEFCRYHVWHVTKNAQQVTSGELEEASAAVAEARAIASRKLLEQAAQHGAEFVIGSDVKVSVREVPCGYGGCPLDDLDVDVSVFGTGVRRTPRAQQVVHAVPDLILSMMPLGRRRDAVIDGEDDADDVEIAAEEATEAALERDEAAAE
ncbi:MAG: heavy metal-binding domain-containing protein [Deltaproteobacteria bacterium]|nr:heavy metal-binding domain-containing protein [Deltaproteobacteria bacterium]